MKTIVLSMGVGEAWHELAEWTHEFRKQWAERTCPACLPCRLPVAVATQTGARHRQALRGTCLPAGREGCEALTEIVTDADAKQMSSRPASWLKLRSIQRLIRDGHDVIWMDADGVPTGILTADMLRPQEESSIVVGNDCNGMNCGMMGFACSEWTNNLLTTWWDYPCDPNNAWWEQRALRDMVEAGKFPGRVQTIPQHLHFLHAAGIASAGAKLAWLRNAIEANGIRQGE